MRLLAMFYEASNNTFKAQELYLEIIEKTPEDTMTMKRLISLYKNNDMPNDAIAMLNKYLEVNQTDEEGWIELCDMYLNVQNFSKAQYCFEELLTINPLNYQHNIKYAEILYSQAVATQFNVSLMEHSRKYFAHALVLIDNENEKVVNNNVARALWGLLRVCKAIRQSLGDKKQDGKNDEMIEIATRRIKDIYSQNTDLDVSKMAIMS